MAKSVDHLQSQSAIFAHYQSLDLTNKIYQVKALRLAKFHNHTLAPYILELGSADDTFLHYAVKQIGGKGQGLDITKGDNFEEKLKIKKNSVDIVFALEIIEHLFDTDFFLSEIHRVLKPSGILILSTPNLASLQNRLRLLLGRYPKYLEYSKKGAGHIHLYTPNVLKSQLLNTKYLILNTCAPNFLCPFITRKWFPKILREFCMFLGDIFPTLGSHLLVVARKNA